MQVGCLALADWLLGTVDVAGLGCLNGLSPSANSAKMRAVRPLYVVFILCMSTSCVYEQGVCIRLSVSVGHR